MADRMLLWNSLHPDMKRLHHLVPVQNLYPPVLPSANLALGSSKFLVNLILYKHARLGQTNVSRLTEVGINTLSKAFDRNIEKCYKESVDYYQYSTLDELLRDLIRAEGVHTIPLSILQAYLSNHGWIKPKALRPTNIPPRSKTGLNYGVKRNLGEGAFKQPRKGGRNSMKEVVVQRAKSV